MAAAAGRSLTFMELLANPMILKRSWELTPILDGDGRTVLRGYGLVQLVGGAKLSDFRTLAAPPLCKGFVRREETFTEDIGQRTVRVETLDVEVAKVA
jgi:hypothetical protein